MDSSGFITLGMVALAGLILKLVILFNIEIKTPLSRSFAVLCLVLLLQNTVEFLTYFTYLRSESFGLIFINCYMLIVYFIAPALLSLVLRLTESKLFFPISVCSYLGSVFITTAHAFGLVVTGYDFIGWSIISTPGPFYGISMLVIAFNLLLAVGLLVTAIFTSSYTHIVSRCKVCLLAFTPLLAVFAGVQLARVAGYQSSSAISLPIATLLFLFIMLHETKDNLYWLSTKFQMVFALLLLDKSKTTEEVINQLEDIRIRAALRTTGGIQKDAAKLVCLPASTLNKKIAKYGIDVKEYRAPRSTSGSPAT